MAEATLISIVNACVEFYQTHWNLIEIILMLAYTAFSAYTFVAEKPSKIRTIIAFPGMILFVLLVWVAVKIAETPTERER